MTGEMSPAGGPGELRASHADRDRVVEVLRVAAGDGRISADELDQRLEAALTARTLRELAVLTTDLPASPGHPASIAAGPPKDLMRIDCDASHTRREGAWIVPQRLEVRITGGSVRLDFTDAVITHPTLRLHAEVNGGHLVLITGRGVVVDADDVSVSAGHVKVTPPAAPAGPVALRIEITGSVQGGHLVARSPTRTFWQWLLRRRPTRPALPG
jgi:hypothetical protein